MLTLTVFVLISYKDLFDLTPFDDLLGTSFKGKYINWSSSTGDTCKYDEAARELIILAGTEIFTMIVIEFVKAFLRKLFFQRCLKKEVWQPIVTEGLSDFSVWMLYNKAIHWLI